MKMIHISRMLATGFLWLVLSLSICGQKNPSTLYGPYFGQTPPGNTPVLFAPPELQSNEEWFWHGAPAFSIDSTEFYPDIYYPNTTASGARIRQLVMTDSAWGPLQQAPFAEDYLASGLTFAADGNKVYWVSDRPGGLYWSSTRENMTWTPPVPEYIPIPASLGNGWRISMAGSGRIYLHLLSFNANDWDLYMTQKINGQYTIPARLNDSVNSPEWDVNVFVDPDEEYLIFETERPGGQGLRDIGISFKKSDQTWSKTVLFGYPLNTMANEHDPYVSPDKKYLFFLSDRDTVINPYWVSTSVIDSLRQIVTSTAPPKKKEDGIRILQIIKRPSSHEIIFRISLPKECQVSIDLFDLAGNLILASVEKREYTIGIHEINVNLAGVPEGIYLYRFETGNMKTVTGKLLIDW